MNGFENLKIKHKIFCIILINAVFLGLVTLMGYRGLSNLITAKNSIVTNIQLIKHQLMAQNMCDNIRGDIYRAISVDKSNTEEVRVLKQEFKEHVSIFAENISEIQELQLSEDFLAVLNEINTSSLQYQDLSQRLFDLLLSEDFAAFELIEPFRTSFSVLETQMSTMGNFIDKKTGSLEESGDEVARMSMMTIFAFAALAALSLLVSFLLSAFITNNIARKISNAEAMVSQVAVGRIPEKQEVTGTDEVSRMLTSLNSHIDSLRKTSVFATEIGNGNFSHEYEPLSEEDILGQALIGMRDNLEIVAADNKKRNWYVTGQARFGELLRKNQDDIKVLGDGLMSELVKYMEANQGCLYIVNDDMDDNEYLELISCYAWNKKKYTEDRIGKGQGLAGQAWQEGNVIFMTDVPVNYVKITSGLGKATPTCIIIQPLKINDEVFGIIELGSFHIWEEHQKEFLEKVAESIASAVSGARINQRTRILLEQSQQQAEEMRAQEEEMRQNQEELQATQEEMERQKAEMVEEIKQLKSVAGIE